MDLTLGHDLEVRNLFTKEARQLVRIFKKHKIFVTVYSSTRWVKPALPAEPHSQCQGYGWRLCGRRRQSRLVRKEEKVKREVEYETIS